MFQGTRRRIGREGVSEETPTSASRSTTPDSRHDRRPDVPSKPSGEIIVGQDSARIIQRREKSTSD
jgi:hypothetical protein